MEALWPAVVDANRSEKPSVVKLLDAVLEAVGKFVDTIDIEQSVGDNVVTRARALWTSGRDVAPLVFKHSVIRITSGELSVS